MKLELDAFQQATAPSGATMNLQSTEPRGTTGQVLDPAGVNHPAHYNLHPSGIECIAIKRHLSSNLGDAFKYVFRRGEKGDAAKDLHKAIWYLRDEAEHLKEAARSRIDLQVLVDLRAVIEQEPDALAKTFYQALHDYLIDLTPTIPKQAQLIVVLVAAQRLLHTYERSTDLDDV